jgi:hypothetical protein
LVPQVGARVASGSSYRTRAGISWAAAGRLLRLIAALIIGAGRI